MKGRLATLRRRVKVGDRLMDLIEAMSAELFVMMVGLAFVVIVVSVVLVAAK
ncbi:MAG: hypothetical protein WBV77_10570 [Solirubrobacteraceae bacterium]|jgi:hypothetical protein